MQLSHVIVSQSILWIIASALLLFFPSEFLGLLGPRLSAFGLVVTRIFGAELMGFAIASWVTHAQQGCRTGLIWAYITCNTLGFLICLQGVLSGVMKPAAWILAGLYLWYAVLFAYFRLAPRKQD